METHLKNLHGLARSGLGNRFRFLFILIASIPLLILGNISLFLIDSSHRVDVANLQIQLIAEHEERISAFIGETLDVMELRVSVSDIEQIGHSGKWQEFLAEGLMENPSFREVSFVNTGGAEEAYRLHTGLQRVRRVNMSELPAFVAARGGNTFIGDVYQTSEGSQVSMAAPVMVENKVVQIIMAEISLRDIQRPIEAARLGNEGYIALLDEKGAFIAGGNPTAGIKPGTSFSQYERVKRLQRGEDLRGLDRQDRYQGYFSDNQVSGAGKVFSETGWMLMTEWPVKDADLVVAKIRAQILLVTISSIIGVLILAHLFSERLVRPIRLLQSRAADIEKGNFEKKVIIKTKDELEELGTSFNKMAEGLKRLDELKNEFVYISTHELRAPVTAIKGYLSLIEDGSGGPVSGKLRELLKPVQLSNERLVRLVNDLLEVARSEAGKLSVDIEEGDLRRSVAEIVLEAQSLAKGKEITLTYEKPESLPLVLFDEMRIKEVIMNLISNAIKYNNKGGWVKISHEVQNDVVVTSVADNGFGIAEEDQKHMFEKFFRAKTRDTKGVTGTGLGMFITKEIIKKNNGSIQFTSKLDKGSCFSFTLPMAKDGLINT